MIRTLLTQCNHRTPSLGSASVPSGSLRTAKAPSSRVQTAFAAAALTIAALWCSGCSRSPYGYNTQGLPSQAYASQFPPGSVAPGAPPSGPASVFAQQATNPQLLELQRRVRELDENNRQLTTQMAQAQQQSQAFRERAELLARQLQDASSQNKELLAATQQIATQARGMQASMAQRGGARLTANNSVANSASGLQISGAQVIPDGDVVRIRISADQLFSPGTAQPNPAGGMLLDQVASALTRQYPRQRAGIEGHTDTAQLYNGITPYQLASAQSQAVMDQLVRRGGVPMQQLFVIAHGPNHPIADNQSPTGRAENRRIEIVIYPETY